MSDYTCAKCKSPCSATLWGSGAGSDCCEANLMVDNDDGDFRMMDDAPKSGEITLLVRHANFAHDPSDRWEAEVRATWTDFNGGGWTWYGMSGIEMGWRPILRELTAAEHRDLTEELAEEQYQEMIPAMRARSRWLDGE